MILRTTLIGLVALAGLAVAQEQELSLPSCEQRCYDMASQLMECDVDDLACVCDRFSTDFYPQYTSCLIEGCATSMADITEKELRSWVCESEESVSPEPTMTDPPTVTATTSEEPPETTDDEPDHTHTLPTSSGSDVSSSHSPTTSAPPEEMDDEPDATHTLPSSSTDKPPTPTQVGESVAGRVSDPTWYLAFWMGLMGAAAVLVA